MRTQRPLRVHDERCVSGDFPIADFRRGRGLPARRDASRFAANGPWRIRCVSHRSALATNHVLQQSLTFGSANVSRAVRLARTIVRDRVFSREQLAAELVVSPVTLDM